MERMLNIIMCVFYSCPTLLQDHLSHHQPTDWTKVSVILQNQLLSPVYCIDMGGRSAYPQPPSAGYGYPEGLGGGRAEYSYPTAHSRIPLRPQHRGAMGLYAPPPQYLPIPHGLSLIYLFLFSSLSSPFFTHSISFEPLFKPVISVFLLLSPPPPPPPPFPLSLLTFSFYASCFSLADSCYFFSLPHSFSSLSFAPFSSFSRLSL